MLRSRAVGDQTGSGAVDAIAGRWLGRIYSGIMAAMFLLLLTMPPQAGGHEAELLASATDLRSAKRVIGGKSRLLSNGLFAVTTDDGYRLSTHGPDPVEANGDGLGPGGPERAPFCAPDPGTGYYQRVLYAYPSNEGNALADRIAAIRSTIRRNDYKLDAESQASGGGRADYIMLCDAVGEIAVDPFSVPTSNGVATFDEIVDAARDAGFTDTKLDYTIFFDGAAPEPVCGVGTVTNDDRADINNYNNNSESADYGAVYEGCWDGRTAMHENGHNQGAVQLYAPYATGPGGWHCYQGSDVMCYSPDGGLFHQTGTVACPVAPATLHFDCGWDTYFDTAPEPGEWLASHWNLGSPLNRFIGLTPVGGGADAFANAAVLNGGVPTVRATGSNAVASKEPGEPDHGGSPGGRSIWYQWTANRGGKVTVDTCGSTFDTTLGVYVGTSIASGLEQIVRSDDSCGYGSKVWLDVEAGMTYRIAVDGYRYSDGSVATGDVRLTVQRQNVPPDAGFTTSCSGLTCSFKSTSADRDGTIASYRWTLGDGQSQYGPEVQKSYPSPGAWEVTLEVTDDAGASDHEIQMISLSGDPPPGDPPPGDPWPVDPWREAGCDDARAMLAKWRSKLIRARASGRKKRIRTARRNVSRARERIRSKCY